MRKTLLSVFVALLCTAQLFAIPTTRFVPGSYSTIALAITAAVDGDIVDIAAGTYTEKLTCSKGLTFQGAGIGQTIVQASLTPTSASSGEVFNLDGTYGAGVTITIKNMTVQNGYNAGSGGGIRLQNVSTTNTPTLDLQNLKIYNNTGNNGGGVYVAGQVILKVTGCNITGNSAVNVGAATGGGGIAITPGGVYAVNATIKNSSISNNSVEAASANNGGGIAVICGNNASTAVAHSLWIENTTIYGNSTNFSGKVGGGIYFKTASVTGTVAPTQIVTLNHCTIVNNTTNASSGGDGVCIDNLSAYATTLAINNSIIIGNSSSGIPTNVSQVGVNAASQTKIANGGVTNSILGSSGIIGSWITAGATNNDLTSSSTALAFAASLSSDAVPALIIGAGSVAKDFVTTDYISLPLTSDQVGNSRAGNADAGAYEYNPSLAISATAGAGGTLSTDPTGTYASGTSVTAIATPSGSNVFKNWTVGTSVVSSSASYTFAASKAQTLTANFTLQYNVQTANDGNGAVTGSGVVVSGSPTTLTATGNAGYAFNAWSVSAGSATISTSANPLTFTPSADCTISATFKNITALTPTLTYSRTATTLDLLVTNPVGYTGTLTYTVLDVNNNVLATGVAASAYASTLVYSATGLSVNSSNTYKVVAVINGTINSVTASVVALTRKMGSGSVQLIDDFVDNSLGWDGQNGPTLTIPFTNPITDGINASSTCAKVYINVGKSNYTGLQNTKSRIDVGPSAPYQYLHIKMYRDADAGTLGLTFLARTDISQIQFGSPENYAITPSASGPWVDYVFNLKDAAYTTNKSAFGFYIKCNNNGVNALAASYSYIDDIYLSNDATPSIGAVVDVATKLAQANTISNSVIVKGKVLQIASDVKFVQVYDVTGTLVRAQKPLDGNVSLTTSGVYVVKMTTDQGPKVQKVIVQ